MATLSLSCKKFLDKQPYSQATDQTTWQSEGDANASVAACYSLIRSAFNAAITYYTYGDLPSDEFSSIVSGPSVASYSDIQSMTWNTSIPYTNTGDPRLQCRTYTNFYTAIAQSNRCLYYINNMPASVFSGTDAPSQQASKNRYIAEAYFTRAFNYFYMARVWGDVPLITAYDQDVSASPQLPRSPQNAILTQCIADLTIAKSYMGWNDQPNPADIGFRADKGAVFALMAHIYAWKGNYDSCSMACDSIILSGPYQLADRNNYRSIFNTTSTENIFAIAQNQQSESIVVSASISGVTLAAPYLPGVSAPGWQINTNTLYGLFDDTTNDLRYKNAFTLLSNGGIPTPECIKYSTIQNINNNSAYQVAENNIIIFRLADIELLKAEALAARTNPDLPGAMTFVNAIRTAAGLPTMLSAGTRDSVLNYVMDERGRELFLEGHRFYDLIRLERLTGQQTNTNINTAEFAAGKYYWPVDPSLFLTNSKLTQTPFWKGKIQ
jgi:hypothetical protein